jgi:hypothetical protein
VKDRLSLDPVERVLRLLTLAVGVLVILCFPGIFLTWPDGHLQVIQAVLSLVGAGLAGFYLMLFRRQTSHRRGLVRAVLVGTSGLLVLECIGVVLVSFPFD